LKIDENHILITFDIKDLYFNIPIKETLRITEALLTEHNNEHITKQTVTLLEIILQQKYFSFQNNIYQPEKKVSPWDPPSPILSQKYSCGIYKTNT
jgi:hypothetical protein